MKRNTLLIVMVSIFVLLLTTPGYSWQGRMAGMGDASGLIEDESDFLIHPAAIASGKGLSVYGNYRLTYDKATDWNYTSSMSSLVYPYSVTGEAWKNEGQMGVAFPLGTGRMGVFFEYTGIQGKYSGDETNYGLWGNTHLFGLKDDLYNYAIKVLYGLPVGNMNVGGEIQIAYKDEEKESIFSDSFGIAKNYPWAAETAPALNLYPYMIPFDSRYWEALGKLSVEGTMGDTKYALTFKGGLPFSSKNKYDFVNYNGDAFILEGNVKGFNVGADAKLRFPVNSNLILPFVLSTGYKEIKRDGSGLSNYDSSVAYEQATKDFFVNVGGGIDYTPAQGLRLAAGFYYDYFQSNKSMYLNDLSLPNFDIVNYSDMPKQTEHRLTLKALAEKELSSTVVLRGGFNIFYGIVKSDYAYSAAAGGGPFPPVNLPTSGSNIGVNASIGATVKLDKVSLEPFINAGYVKYKTSGDGTFGTDLASADFDKTNWLVGGGLSLKF